MQNKSPKLEREWKLGSFIVLASTLSADYEGCQLTQEDCNGEPCGTVTLECGTEVTWIDLGSSTFGTAMCH